MSIWEKTEGLAIAKYPFLASGEKQIPMLTGDKFKIMHKTENWLHGRNLFTGLDGIFPSSFVTFYEGAGLNSDILLGKEEDLLRIEAKTLIRQIIEFIESGKADLHGCKAKCFDQLFNILDSFMFFNENQNKPELFKEKHREISKSLDKLYKLLGQHVPIRTSTNSLNTLTTWGREMFVQKIENGTAGTLPEYVLLSVHVDIKNLKKPTSLRFALFQGKASPFISTPMSFIVQPSQKSDLPSVDLLFDQLDLPTCKDPMYLVIYSFDFVSTKSGDFDDRECTSCALIELPTCRGRNIFQESQKKPKVREGMSYTATENIQLLHYNLFKGQSALPGTLSYVVRWTAYQGTYNNLVNDTQKNLAHYTRVPPFSLPQTVVPSDHRSTVFFTIHEIEQKSKRKRSKLIIKLLDSQNNVFVPCIENIESHEFNQAQWSTTTFRGSEKIVTSETFALDLSKTNTPLEKLFIVIDLQRSNVTDSGLYSSCYAIVKLSDLDGYTPRERIFYHWNTRGNQERKPESFPLEDPSTMKKKPQVAGHIQCSFWFASTTHTTNNHLWQLVKYNLDDKNADLNKIKEAMEHWNQIPISEWSKFVKELLLNFCVIISTKDQLANDAFECLKDVFVKVLVTPTYGGHVKLLDEFVKEDFPAAIAMDKYQCLQSLFQTVISNINRNLQNIDITTTEYRSLIKVTPYLLRLVALSYKVASNGLKENSKMFEKWNTSISGIFKRFDEIIAYVPDDNEKDSQKKSSTFAVQTQILTCFGQIIEAVHVCTKPSIITNFIISFFSKIRNKEGDRKQILIEKSKVRVILFLSSTQCWINQEERQALQDLFRKQLMDASKVPATIDLVNITLASLFFSVRNDFIIQFIPVLEDIYHRLPDVGKDNEIEPKKTLSRLLLTIAFTFPEVFVEERNELIVQLMKSNLIGPRERLFTFAHYLRENEEKLISLMQDPSFMFKKDIIMVYLDLAIEAKSKAVESIIDDDIYPSTADFSVVNRLLASVSNEEIEEKFSDIPGPLIKCYALYSTKEHHIKDLEEMFNILIPAGFKVSVIRTTYDLRKSPGFEIVPEIFNDKAVENGQTKNDIRELRKFAKSVSDITNLKVEEVRQDTLVEAYSTIIATCEKYQINELIPELLFGLVNIHDEFKNTIEQAFAIVKLCRIYEPSNYPPTEEQAKFIPFLKVSKGEENKFTVSAPEKTTCRNMRDILIALYLKAVNLFTEGNCIYPAYALPIIKEIKERCIIPEKITKPLSKILEIESKIYKLSSSNDQVYFFFYRVFFTGNGFDESVRNKTMMYRTNGFLKADQFMKKLGLMFPGSQCFQSEEQYEMAKKNIDPVNGMLILVTNAEPTSEEEVKNPFRMKDIATKPKFAHMYQSNTGLRVFKTQVSRNIKDKTMVNEFLGARIFQTYYFTDGEFPTYSRRLNVVEEKTFERLLPPIQTACYMMTQQVEEIMILINTFAYYHHHGTNVDNGQIGGFRMKIKGTVEASVNGGIKNYIDAFFTDAYISQHPDDQQYVDKLKEILGELMRQVQIALQTIEPFCKDENQQKQQKANEESYNELLEQMQNAGVKV